MPNSFLTFFSILTIWEVAFGKIGLKNFYFYHFFKALLKLRILPLCSQGWWDPYFKIHSLKQALKDLFGEILLYFQIVAFNLYIHHKKLRFHKKSSQWSFHDHQFWITIELSTKLCKRFILSLTNFEIWVFKVQNLAVRQKIQSPPA